MPRKLLRRILPDRQRVCENRFLRRFGHRFTHSPVWHLNRRSVAGGVAVGLFAGLIPGPLQVLTSGALSIGFRTNLPVAIVVTFYTNPFTIGPLYWFAYLLGSFLTGSSGGNASVAAFPEFSGQSFGSWLAASLHWAVDLGPPLLIGLPAMAVLLALAGYVLVFWGWRGWVLIELALRRRKRSKGDL